MYRCLFVAVNYNRFVFTPWQESIVALADNSVVFHEDTADMKAVAGASCGGYLDDLFEVLVPCGAR